MNMSNKTHKRIAIIFLLLFAPAIFPQNVARKAGRAMGIFKESFLENTTKRVLRRELMEEALSQGCKNLLELNSKKVAKTLAPTQKTFFDNSVSITKSANLKQFVSNNGFKLRKNLTPTYLESKIAKSRITQKLDVIKAKGPLSLDSKEYKDLLEHPNYLRGYIKTYGDGNFQDFFIRLSLGNKEQTIEILSNKEIREYVNRAIRNNDGGGVHEWLMTKNYMDFLTNPKWGDDGPFLALSLTELVQKTPNVKFKGGGTHFDKINSGSFHNGLSKVIDDSSTKEELFINVKKYAQETLTDDSYEEFYMIFCNMFNPKG